jgi:nitroreductase
VSDNVTDEWMRDALSLTANIPLLHFKESWRRGVQQTPLLQDHIDRVASLTESLKWINVQAVLLDVCIAFYPLDLPPYVLLEIVDRFPFWSTHVNRKKKIDYIVQIKRFCDCLISKRSRN